MRLLLVTTAILSCAFAPAPPLRTGVAEAAVNGFGSGPSGVKKTLLAALPQLLQTERVKTLACLKGEGNPREWLNKRLRAEELAPGGPVRVRVGDCRPEEALALLTALVEAHEARFGLTRAAYEEELVAGLRAQRVRVVQGGGIAGITLNERNPDRRDAPAVLQRPRLIISSAAR